MLKRSKAEMIWGIKGRVVGFKTFTKGEVQSGNSCRAKDGEIRVIGKDFIQFVKQG